MQPNREVYERKISQVYEMMDVGDYKKALRQVTSYLEKGGKKMNIIEKLSYQLVKAYILDKSNRREEALAESSFVLTSITEQSLHDLHLIDQAELVMREMGHYEKVVHVLEDMNKKVPADKDVATKLFQAYTQSNDFQKMGAMAVTLERKIGLKDQAYSLFALESNYLFWKKVDTAPPTLISLIGMQIEGERKKNYDIEQKMSVPLHFISLYYKVKLAQKEYEQLGEFLEKHQSCFPIELDRQRLIIQVLFKKGDYVGCCNQIIGTIKRNYENLDSFQSIYDLHELLISLIATKLITSEMQFQPLAFLKEVLGGENKVAQGQEFALFPQDCSQLQSVLTVVSNLIGSFEVFQSLKMEDKSTNYHNCRKASLLSQLFLIHKLLVLHGDPSQTISGLLKVEPSQNKVAGLVMEFGRRYIESSSAYYDLLPFVPLLNRAAREWVAGEIEKENAAKEDKIRQLRSNINLYKLKMVFGLFSFGSGPEVDPQTLALVRQLQLDYLSGLKMDGKPEKGERKLADDLLLLINELLSNFSEKWTVYFRIGLLEYGLEQSPYNFDFQLNLIKIYDSLGCSFSFSQGVQYFNLKGIQLESMGYIQLRHCLDWGDLGQLEAKFLTKYHKFLKNNLRDLKQVKTKALKENNFEQIENFVDIEDFMEESYFKGLLKFVNWLGEFGKAQGWGKELAQEFFGNMGSVLEKGEEEIAKGGKRNRTQDLKILKGNLEVVDEFENFREIEDSWITDLSYNNEYLSEVISRDKVLCYLKFPATSNFKENFTNSLGVFEDPAFFKLLHSVMGALSRLRKPQQPNEEEKESVVEGLKRKYGEHLKEREARVGKARKLVKGERLDELAYGEEIKAVHNQVELILSILEVAEKLSLIKKVEGEPNAKLIEKILLHKDAFNLMIENIKAQVLKSQNELKQFEDGNIARVRVKFIESLIQGSLFLLSIEFLGEKLKAVVPSKGKKKGGQQDQSLEVLQQSLILPLKTMIKDLVTHLQTDYCVEQQFEGKKGEEVEKVLNQINVITQDWHQEEYKDSHLKIIGVIEGKSKELVKEEKVCRERLKETAVITGKKLKEIASTYLP